MQSVRSLAATKHGMSRTRPYHVWCGMKTRCDNKLRDGARWYAGVSYTPSWESFSAFWCDMSEGYADDLTLERKDVTKGYSKENCIWIPLKDQSKNRRDTILIDIDGVKMCLSDYAKKVGLNRAMLYSRYKNGVPLSELAKPSRKQAINPIRRTI